MSKYFCIAEASFASAHRDPEEGPHPHGHTFHVRATEQGTDGGVGAEILGDLRSIVGELHLHDLGDMLYGGSQTLTGLAAWIMERLLSRHPRLTSVEVWTDEDYVVGISREIR